ncbi:hypothetical protein QKS76_gp1 [Cryphonectria parasitica sclerotimonavirus 1]|uniref:Uncharacterized protein n=1 Tax=Cryphonectria parasitica sclerotimonavirus 1 TaxID=2755404 RepID=A0AAE7IIC4_9MONO|nr:hypothetical protein QKS76_gp1 [Cryphonectria parasitica sclerotimonavirus 1]QMP84021.1 hypothetical protein [Cryphonectria parasitica sclerotimonavirus 1]
MPSYKYKYETVLERLNKMENRILIDESVLLRMKEELDNLQMRINDKQSASEGKNVYLQSQLVLAINEIEELCFRQKRTPNTIASGSTDLLLEHSIASLHTVAKMLRDSHVRANTITGIMRTPKRHASPSPATPDRQKQSAVPHQNVTPPVKLPPAPPLTRTPEGKPPVKPQVGDTKKS